MPQSQDITVSFEELADEIDVPRHIIHLWTKKFPIFSPQRNASGKIGFKKRDISLSVGLKFLLITQKKTIKEVQTLLNERGIGHIIDLGRHGLTGLQNQNTENIGLSKQSENSLSFMPDTTHRSIAKQAFKSLNNLFSKENKDDIPSQGNDVSSDISKETFIQGQADNSHSDIEKSDKIIRSFEDNWRDLMQKEGRVPTIDPGTLSNDIHHLEENILGDEWIIDEEVDLFEAEPDFHTPDISKKINLPEKKIRVLPDTIDVHPISISKGVSSVPDDQEIPDLHTLNQEKIKHIISKLSTVQSDLSEASEIISKALKAFGYSGFENAYNKFDQKSIY